MNVGLHPVLKQAKYGMVWAVLMFSAAFCFGENLTQDRFISPATCGDCHTGIYGQWQNSMHNNAHIDPVYSAVSQFLLQGLTDPGEVAESESCVKCHTPIGHVTGYPSKTSDDMSKVTELAAKGIQCDYCHSATGAKQMKNNGLIISPGYGEDDPGIKRGPFKDSESDFHETAYSAFHTRSGICGTCHNVSHVSFGTKLETTYDEWKNGPYNNQDPDKTVTCQGCHMYQRPGIPATGETERPSNPGTAADDGPKRDHIFTHYFVGANARLPEMFGDKDKAAMAVARLQHSAELRLDTDKIKDGKLSITVANTGAGHYLPTGLTDVRQMWLMILVTDEKGRVLVNRGNLDQNGYVRDDAIIYNTVFGDGQGNPVHNISKAREILKDKRIPPKQSMTETLFVKTQGAKQLIISVKLVYRSAPQKVLDLVLGKGKQTLPVIVMESTHSMVNL